MSHTQPVHSLRPAEVYRSLETSAEGLSAAEAQARLSLYGENRLSEPARTPLLVRLARYPLQMPAPILLLAGAVLWIAGRDPLLGIVIWALVLVNIGLSFFREYRAEQAVEKLRRVLPTFAHVIRNGQEQHIPASEVVPGDVLVLAEGYNIPADARVVEEFGLRTNNATLTGEAVPARKVADASLSPGLSDLERPNLIYAGTSVADGTGRAVAYATGMLTQFGRIAHLTQTVEPEATPFQRELRRLTSTITSVAVGIGLIVVLIGWFELRAQTGMDLAEILVLALGIVVAAIPEGLPATLTLSLAIAVQRLASKGVLAKSLIAVETLGSVSVICTDKSGTLTQNQMTVRDIWVAGRKLKVSGVGYAPEGEITPSPGGQPFEVDLRDLMRAAMLCNNARLNPPNPEHPYWTCLGDQTEAALKVAGRKAGLDEDKLLRELPRTHEVPFDARRKRMSTIHRVEDRSLAFVKGAPREVLQLCDRIQVDGQVRPLEASDREAVLAANDEYARNARRVLAVARRELPLRLPSPSAENVERELTFLGLVAMMDPPRPEVERAVRTCREAGIRIVMITGDYGLTAESLARRVGMLSSPSPRILTGTELEALSDPELQVLLQEETVFARMAPEHKLRLVAAFQSRGEVVAVTGDGVNDAPALRKADVGIAMGMVGTDVAKEAADVIITNDNFDAIVTAIAEGRSVFDNIRKFITYIFSSNVPELMPFAVASLVPGMPLALTVRQILAIDMGTDLLPALALGIENPEPDVMRKPPRRREQPLIDRSLLMRAFLWLGMIEAALCFIGFFSVYVLSGNTGLLPAIPLLARLPVPEWLRFALDPEYVYPLAVTVFHAGVVMAQFGNVFACRSERLRGRQVGWLSNSYLWLSVGIEIAGILAMIYFPPLARAFGHEPLPGIYWYGLILFPLVIYGSDWLRKRMLGWLDRLRRV